MVDHRMWRLALLLLLRLSLSGAANPSPAPSPLPTAQKTIKPTFAPTALPSPLPTGTPTAFPTKFGFPTLAPTIVPTGQPTRIPSSQPSVQPTSQPTGKPTRLIPVPTPQPTAQPTFAPTTAKPTITSPRPTFTPSLAPIFVPINAPTPNPSPIPTARPTAVPTLAPSAVPSITMPPSRTPTPVPTVVVTPAPTALPTAPSARPSPLPTRKPTALPSARPTAKPTIKPTLVITTTTAPTPITTSPTGQPTRQPTSRPTRQPTGQPSGTSQPSKRPSAQPVSRPTSRPSRQPTGQPTGNPTRLQLGKPTREPTPRPTNPTGQPTCQPSAQPSRQPTGQPTSQPTRQPTSRPSRQPSGQPTGKPTRKADGGFISKYTRCPTGQPSRRPSGQPSMQPTSQPTGQPSGKPSMQPSAQPSRKPTGQPSMQPTSRPTGQPSRLPSGQPSAQPSCRPTAQPSSQPSQQPTGKPSRKADGGFISKYSRCPTGQPSGSPTGQPSMQPSAQPSRQPTGKPTRAADGGKDVGFTRVPTGQPSGQPSMNPTGQPSREPSMQPSGQPTRQPTMQPSSKPTSQPSNQPSCQPTAQPTRQPTGQPSRQPTRQPTGQPSRQPTGKPSRKADGGLISQNTRCPTGQPSRRPTGQPTTAPSIFLPATSSPTATFQRENMTGTVAFYPLTSSVCEDVEIRFVFKSTFDIEPNITYRFNAPGLTTQGCSTGKQMNNTLSGMQVQSSRDFTVRYFEGIIANSFLGSYFLVTPMNFLPRNIYYRLAIDRANGLQRTCPSNNTWSVFRSARNISTSVYQPSLYQTHKMGLMGTLTPSYYLSTLCYTVNSSISFFPPMQQFQTSINISLTLGFNLQTGDYITVYLPGFTNANSKYPLNQIVVNSSTYYIPKGKSRNLYLYGNTTTFTTSENLRQPWSGSWHEGSNSSDPHTAWADPSRLRLYPNHFYPAGQPFWVLIDRYPNGLVSLYGRPHNYPAFRFKISSSLYYTNATSFGTAMQIGDGCKSQNFCSGNGNCDYSTSKCVCFNGFGSASDKLSAVSDDFNPDCSSRTCPLAPAVWASAGDFSTVGFHRQLECSNRGVCTRSTGKCTCFSGHTGFACERMTCPGTPACSGRGVCKAITQLAQDSTALRLSRGIQTYHDLSHDTDSLWLAQQNLTAPIDGGTYHACVCDSSWPVGLSANQSQLSEYFGSACELRRCPSGDDPRTQTINELNCTGITQTYSGDSNSNSNSNSNSKGAHGNLCHVDCSNVGVCDYNTGVCSCFQGWTGANCGQRVYAGFNANGAAPLAGGLLHAATTVTATVGIDGN